MEAMITGGGRDTFMIQFFATDYSWNQEQYLSKKEQNVKLCGLVFVLDKSKDINTPALSIPKLSKDFTGYMPSKDVPDMGCFDFVGVLESFHEFDGAKELGVTGFMLRVRLIENPEERDFFTIDMFVNKANMRFDSLKVGMKLTGMFQLLGELAD